MTGSSTKRNPDALTIRIASGLGLPQEAVVQQGNWLNRVRSIQSSQSVDGDNGPLAELIHIYTGTRILQGSVVAGRLAVPAFVHAGSVIRRASLPEDLDAFATHGRSQTEEYLSGYRGGVPLPSNDYPELVKVHIAALAGILQGSYKQAYDNLCETSPALLSFAQDADELQRLCWARIREIIDHYVPADEVDIFRAKPLRIGTDELLAVIRQRTGVSIPPRIMQRDNWQECLEAPRQSADVSVFNSIKFFVENAEVGFSYFLGSLLTRILIAETPGAVFKAQIRFGVQDIAAGTHTFTHQARFQSRIGARPNDYRSFGEFLRNVRRQANAATIASDGDIRWAPFGAQRGRGWCPARHRYAKSENEPLEGIALAGLDAVKQWKEYGRSHFGVEPLFAQLTAGELFGAIILFGTVYRDSVFVPGSGFVEDLLEQIARRHESTIEI